jgi:acyl-coenzyme A thioesterase PaaI-like protein
MIDWHGEIAFSIVEASDEHVRARIPVTPSILNPLGTVRLRHQAARLA